MIRQALATLKRGNWALMAAIAALMVVGVLFIFSAAYGREAIGGTTSYYKKQIVWAALGIACHLGCALVDYHRVARFSGWLYGGSIGLLILVFLIGTDQATGAKRWLSVFGVNVQPSEFAKLATLLCLAQCLSQPALMLQQRRIWAMVALMVGVPLVLILRQPDLGTSMIFVPMAMVMAYIAGFPVRVLRNVVVVAALGVGLLVGALVLPAKLGMAVADQERIERLTGLSAYQADRIRVYFDSDLNPLGVGWNKAQSEIAVGSGGLTGKGFLNGTQNILGFLPRTVAPTDFIYSVIAEETGFVGSILVLTLFAVVLACAAHAALLARDKMGRLLCVGVMTLIFSHVFINIAMTVGLMPITGLPLPLVSYGGSFMISTMIALGIIQSVYIRRYGHGVG